MLRLFWDSVILEMYEVEKNIISAYIIQIFTESRINYWGDKHPDCFCEAKGIRSESA